jgi:hypothetical protein
MNVIESNTIFDIAEKIGKLDARLGNVEGSVNITLLDDALKRIDALESRVKELETSTVAKIGGIWG